MSPIKLEQQHDINLRENELEEPFTLGSISNNTKEAYYDLELHPGSNLPGIDDSNHSGGQSFLRTLAGQHKVIYTCTAFSVLCLSSGFLVNQILRALVFLPARINNSNASELIEIIDTWETDILSPQYLWLSAKNLQQDGHLQRPIHLLKYISENSELYVDAQAEILALQNEVWEMARARYEAGEQDEALMIAKSIQPSSSHYDEAQTTITRWEQTWKTDKPKAEQITALAESAKWDDWMTVRSLYNELTNPYWKNETVSIYWEIEKKIVAEQERMAQQQTKNSSGESTTPRITSPSYTSPRPRSVTPSSSLQGRPSNSNSADSIIKTGRPETESGGNPVRDRVSRHSELLF